MYLSELVATHRNKSPLWVRRAAWSPYFLWRLDAHTSEFLASAKGWLPTKNDSYSLGKEDLLSDDWEVI